jgi:hypothetical protein
MRKVLVTLALLLAGCAPTTMYRWGGYDKALYDHYKNPQDRQQYVADLAVVIADAEKEHAKVPPGCYAEYGWALFEEGQTAQATAFFEKEAKQWPESKPLMDKLIRNATRAAAPSAAAAPTTPAPAAPAEVAK